MRRTRRIGQSVGLVLALVLSACELPAAAPPARLWTLFDLARANDEGTPVAQGALGLPAGILASDYLTPRAVDGGPRLRISSAFSEGANAAYVTTEVWSNVPEVWVQPMYILVTAWDDTSPVSNYLEGAPWIYTVGPSSAFYSPYWRVYWAVVPPDTSIDKYTSSQQLIADKVELHEGPGRLVALVPDGTAPEDIEASLPGRLGRVVGSPSLRKHERLDGQAATVTGVDFGADRFAWTDALEVIAQPLFVFEARQLDGTWARAGAPNVGGTRPLFTRQTVAAPRNRPNFGSFWRIHTVHLPANGMPGLFLPRALDAVRAEVTAGLHGLPLPVIDWDVVDPADAAVVNAHALEIALNAKDCFASRAALDSCQWLDSQTAIEEKLPAAIAPTGMTATCPFITFNGAMVPVQ